MAFTLAVLTAPLATPAQAKEKPLGTFGAWRAYTYDEEGQTVCYMVTTKAVRSPAVKRGTSYLMITHRPIEASIDVISYGAGLLLDSRRGVKITVGPKSFDLFSVRDTAWARDTHTDHKLAAALVAAPAASTSGLTTIKGKRKAVIDKFTLTGGAAAYHAIGKACGIAPRVTPKAVAKKTARPLPIVKKRKAE